MSLPTCNHDLAYKHPLVGGESYCCACLRAVVDDLTDALRWLLPDPEACERCARVGGLCVGHTALAKAESSR